MKLELFTTCSRLGNMLASRDRQAVACMRSASLRTRSNVALAMLFALIVLACCASSARAEVWGQVERFKLTTGTEAGQVDENRLVRFAAGSDGSYYVLTEAGNGEFVLQRYDEHTMQASVHFKRPEEEEETNTVGTEGTNAILAVDPSRNRVYVLLVYERREQNEKEEKEEEKDKKPVFPLDDEMPAAGSLYGFEYKSGDNELVSKKTNKAGLPAPQLTRKQLFGQGEEPTEKPLLDPRGMAVDSANGDLAISGNQDEESNAKVESGAQKQCRAAAQFVKVESGSKGELKSLSAGARYVDSAGKILFGQTGCGTQLEEEGVDQAPASPVFAPDGTLLAYGEDESVGPEGVIWQLAPAEADIHAPGEVSTTPKELFVAESLSAFAPTIGEEEPASVMSLVREGAEANKEGTIYLDGDYVITGQPAPAVLHYSDPSGNEPSIAEVGWTAGGPTNENAGAGPCDLHKAIREPIMLGGLSGSKHGLLALTYYQEFEGVGHEVKVPRAEVVEFGEHGSTAGCPTVPLTTPAQSEHGEPTNTVPANSKETLEVTSVLGELEKPAAGAKSVKWTVKFTPVGGKTVEVPYPETKYEHNGLHEEEPGYGVLFKLPLKIENAGTYEISNEVHADDLADEVVKSGVDKLTVTGGRLTVKTKVPVPAEVFAHEGEAELAAEVEVPGEEGKLHVKKVVWEFGDGMKQEESTPQEVTNPKTLTVKHAFSRCGAGVSTKCKIKFTVEVERTAEGVQVESGQAEITVKESKAEEDKRHQEEAAAAAKKAAEKLAEEEAIAKAAAQKQAEEAAAAQKRAEEAAAAKKRAEEEAAAKGGVAGYIAAFSGSTLSVSASGTTSITMTCPTGGSCSGTLTLQTAGAVATSSKKHAPKKILTLASGAFSLSGGGKSVTLRLSSTARSLLSRSHGVLHAKLTILSRGIAGQQNSVTTHVVTLRLVGKKK